jgi:hypothetical protein
MSAEVVMRTRTVVAILSLLPAVSSAQRLPQPRIGGRVPGEPVPLSPPPEPIARALAYKRLNYSVETYPLISFVQAPGFTGDGRRSWMTAGAGTRAEYRLNPYMSATLDLTSSLFGGPVIIQTAEVGARFRPEQREESRWYPFADLRVGFVSAYDRALGSPLVDAFGNPAPQGVYGSRYSNGFGGVAGVGMERYLTRSFALTTGVSVIRTDLSTHDFQSSYLSRDVAMTAIRYSIGIRYNPVRLIRPPGPGQL